MKRTLGWLAYLLVLSCFACTGYAPTGNPLAGVMRVYNGSTETMVVYGGCLPDAREIAEVAPRTTRLVALGSEFHCESLSVWARMRPSDRILRTTTRPFDLADIYYLVLDRKDGPGTWKLPQRRQ